MAKVLVPLVDGFEDIEAVTVIDVLRRGGVEVVTAAVGDAPSVLSAHGLRVTADAPFADAARTETLFVPAGRLIVWPLQITAFGPAFGPISNGMPEEEIFSSQSSAGTAMPSA